jgi:hypothetical protein
VLCRFRFRESVVGKLPATTGWQPVLPGKERYAVRAGLQIAPTIALNDNHLDQAARAAVKNQLPKERLHRA